MVTDRVCITLTQSIVDDKNVNGLVGRLDKFMSEKSIQTFSASGSFVGLKKYYHMLLGVSSGYLLLVHVGKKLLCQLNLWLIFFDVLVSIATVMLKSTKPNKTAMNKE